jgi:hypothetical protein
MAGLPITQAMTEPANHPSKGRAKDAPPNPEFQKYHIPHQGPEPSVPKYPSVAGSVNGPCHWRVKPSPVPSRIIAGCPRPRAVFSLTPVQKISSRSAMSSLVRVSECSARRGQNGAACGRSVMWACLRLVTFLLC